MTVLGRGVSIDIPVGRHSSIATGVDPPSFRITMPRWPGDKEATVIEGPWKPTALEADDSVTTWIVYLVCRDVARVRTSAMGAEGAVARHLSGHGVRS